MFSADVVWDAGNGDGDWTAGFNWNPNGVPNPGDNVTIPAIGAPYPDLNISTSSHIVQNLTIANGASITMGNYNLDVNGDLLVSGAGAFSIGNGYLAVDGSSVLAAGFSSNGGNITLGAGNDGDTLELTADVSISSVSGNIDIDSIIDGDIAGRSLSLDSGSGLLTLSQSIGSSLTLLDLTLDSGGALDLPATSLTGDLTVSAGGNVTQSGVLSGTTLHVKTLLNGGALINLPLANAFTTVNLESRNTADGADAAGNITYNDTNGFDLGTSCFAGAGIRTDGTVTLSGVGALTQSGEVIADTGATTLTFGAGNNISLNDANNDFTTLSVVSGNDVILQDTNAIDLGASGISGILSLTAGGAVTDSGTVTVANNTTINAGVNNITLDDDGAPYTNNFGTLFLTGGNVEVNEGFAMAFGLSPIGGSLIARAATGDITDTGVVTVGTTSAFTVVDTGSVYMDSVGNDFTGNVTFSSAGTIANITVDDASAFLIQAGLTISGNLIITSGGLISDDGAVSVSGNSTFTTDAGGSAITLDGVSTYTGSVGLNTNGAGNADLISVASGIDLAASNVGGDLTVSCGGAITDSGNLTVGGLGTFTAGGVTPDITLGDASTANFLTLDLTGDDVSVVENSAMNVAGASIGAGGSLSLSANGNIIDSGAILADGVITTVDAGANAIDLSDVGNDFGTFDVNGTPSSVIVADIDDLIFAAGSFGATGTVSAGGNVTQSGVLSGTTLHVKTLLNGGALINLPLANAFTTVNLESRNTADGADAAGNITYNDTNGFDLGTSCFAGAGIRTDGTVTLSGVGALTQSGEVIADTGATTLTFGAGNNISLNDANNDFTTLSVVSGNDVILQDTNAIDLGAAGISGILSLTAGGAVTDSGTVTVANNTTINAGVNNITLDDDGAPYTNNFGTLFLTGGNVEVNEGFAMAFGLSPIGGSLIARAATGDITDTGVVTVGTTSAFTVADTGSVYMDSVGNDFTGNVTFSSAGTIANITVDDASAFLIQAGLTISGNLIITSGGLISDDGAVSVSGNSTFTTDAGG
ncbi:S-layer family protein, partial [Oceanispirochaeta sp. M2]|uniref:beta strand repeat-containing protein n=1 Tax=Oceanispirochaeta sp. M2 TaxID=2735869 RepID=UPI001552886F